MQLEDIKKVRKNLGLTQAGLASNSGVSQSLIAKIESGKLDPTFSNAKKIFDSLDRISKKKERKAIDIVNHKILSVRPDSGIKHTIKIMKKHNISQLPVIDENKAVGVVSEATILNAIIDGKKGYVRDIMEDAPPIVSDSTGVKAVSGLLKFFEMVLVAKNGKFKGIITKSDFIEKLY